MKYKEHYNKIIMNKEVIKKNRKIEIENILEFFYQESDHFDISIYYSNEYFNNENNIES
jgi:hypothetical protein